MKIILLLLVTLLSISTNALNIFNLQGKSCEYLEEKLTITTEELISYSILLRLSGGTKISCSENTFQLESIEVTNEDANNLALAFNDETGLNLFNVRKYKLLKKYPNLEKVNDVTYQVLSNDYEITFSLDKNKVQTIKVDWTNKIQKVKKQIKLAERLVYLLDNSLVNIFENSKETIENSIYKRESSVLRKGCVVGWSGVIKESRQNKNLPFSLWYSFHTDLKSYQPLSRVFEINLDGESNSSQRIYNEDGNNGKDVEEIIMDSNSSAQEVYEIFRELDYLCHR